MQFSHSKFVSNKSLLDNKYIKNNNINIIVSIGTQFAHVMSQVVFENRIYS